MTVSIGLSGEPTRTFSPIVLVVTPAKELRWRGVVMARWLFSGEHYFLLAEVDPQQTKLTHGERFSGLLAPLIMSGARLAATKKGFVATNEALKNRVE